MNADAWIEYERARMFEHADRLTQKAEADRLAKIAEVHREFDDAIGTALIRPVDDGGYLAGWLTSSYCWLVFVYFMAVSLGIGLGIATVVFPGVM